LLGVAKMRDFYIATPLRGLQFCCVSRCVSTDVRPD
jgi:hypothetical protein